MHPSYVYACGFFPDTAEERDTRLIIASVCYDQRVRLWLVNIDLDGKCQSNDCLLEMSIIEKPIGNKNVSYYEQDILDDEALQMIVHPDNKSGGGMSTTTKSLFDYIHPNCMTFNANGRLFVGDSRGRISVWDITVR